MELLGVHYRYVAVDSEGYLIAAAHSANRLAEIVESGGCYKLGARVDDGNAEHKTFLAEDWPSTKAALQAAVGN